MTAVLQEAEVREMGDEAGEEGRRMGEEEMEDELRERRW